MNESCSMDELNALQNLANDETDLEVWWFVFVAPFTQISTIIKGELDVSELIHFVKKKAFNFGDVSMLQSDQCLYFSKASFRLEELKLCTETSKKLSIIFCNSSVAT